MNIKQGIERRLSRLEASRGINEYSHMTDEELSARLLELHRQTFSSFGYGDPDKGYERFRNMCSYPYPDDWRKIDDCPLEVFKADFERIFLDGETV